jgi:hypothetical protein
VAKTSRLRGAAITESVCHSCHAFLGGAINYVLSRLAVLVVGVGAPLPPRLAACGGGADLVPAAVLLLLAGGLTTRFVIVRLPHAVS